MQKFWKLEVVILVTDGIYGQALKHSNRKMMFSFSMQAACFMPIIGTILSYLKIVNTKTLNLSVEPFPKIQNQLSQISERSEKTVFESCLDASLVQVQFFYVALVIASAVLLISLFSLPWSRRVDIKFWPSMGYSFAGLMALALYFFGPGIELIRPIDGGYRSGLPPNSIIVFFNAAGLYVFLALLFELVFSVFFGFLQILTPSQRDKNNDGQK